ncbi:MAG: hypothetical protein WD749_14575 [Phycisphaerales bacterium]
MTRVPASFRSVRPRVLGLVLGALAVAAPAPVAIAGPVPVVAARQPAPAGPAIREQVGALMREVSAAVAGADQARYLALVSKSDPVFVTEQRAWALDLGRKAPEEFSVRLSDAEEELKPRDDGSVGAAITFTWRMPGGRTRTVSFPARFERAATPGEGRPAYLYAGEDWKALEAPGVKVLFAEGGEEAAKIVADVLPEIRSHIHTLFELEGDTDITGRVQEVKLYRSMRHLQHSIYLSYTDGLAGWNEPGESVKLLILRNPRRESLRGLIAHEYGHVASFQMGPKANDMPWWLLEGVAEHAAEKYQRNGNRTRTIVRRWATNDGLVDWAKLADFRGEALEHQGNVYTQGHHMMNYITERFGKTKRNLWMRAMSAAEPKAMDEATREVLGLSFADLDREWRESLKPEPAEPDGDAKPEPDKTAPEPAAVGGKP